MAWSKIAEGLARRDFLVVQKNFYWLRRLLKEAEIKF